MSQNPDTRRRALSLFCAVVLLSLGGCETTGGGKPLPRLTFSHVMPLGVSVRQIDRHFVETGTARGMVIDPLDAARAYLQHKFQPVGTRDILDITVENATVKSSHKASNDKIAKYFEVGGTDIYDVTLKLRVEKHDESGRVAFGREIAATRRMHITEHASVSEREYHQLDGLEKMFRDIDREINDLVVREMKLVGP